MENLQLWTNYVRRRQQVSDVLGVDVAGVNETLMFHGSDPEALLSISQEVFQIRYSARQALGSGKHAVLADLGCRI